MPTQSKYPTSVVSIVDDVPDASPLAWSNTSRVSVEDSSGATCTLSSTNGKYSQAIIATGFGFSIPSSATIIEIEVSIRKKASLNTGFGYDAVGDSELMIYKGGARYGNNGAVMDDEWNTFYAYEWYYGDYNVSQPLWGLSTYANPAFVNASDFGISFYAYLERKTSTPSITADIDAIKISIDYTLPKAHIQSIMIGTNVLEVDGVVTGSPVSAMQGETIPIACAIKNNGSDGNVKYELYDADNPATPLDTQTYNLVATYLHTFYTNVVMPNHNFRFFVKASHEE